MHVSCFSGVIAIVYSLLSGVDTQCMNLLSSRDQCRTGEQQFKYMSLRQCLGTCLSRKECLMLQWRQSSMKCLISSKHAIDASYHGPCLTIDKVECQSFDHTCMMKTSGQMYNKHVSVTNVEELDCRFLCVLWSNCSGYTWVKTMCYLQQGLQSGPVLKSKVESSVKQGRKESDCKAGGRNVIFRYGANSNDAKMMDVSGNVTRCFDLLLGESIYSMGVWNIQAKECWLHKKTTHALGFFGEKFDLINFVRLAPIRELTQRVCVKTKKDYNYELSYGVLLEVSSKSECLHICLSTVNCHSVSWGGARVCYLYQVPAEIRRKWMWTLHVVEPCEQGTPMANPQEPKKVVSLCWRRTSSDDSNIRGLALVADITSLLQCCVVCSRASHCTGVTWFAQRVNEKSCYIRRDNEGSAVWQVLSC